MPGASVEAITKMVKKRPTNKAQNASFLDISKQKSGYLRSIDNYKN